MEGLKIVITKGIIQSPSFKVINYSQNIGDMQYKDRPISEKQINIRKHKSLKKI